MVSGAAALMVAKDTTLTPDTVKARLMMTATKSFPAANNKTVPPSSQVTDSGATYTTYYDLFTVGAGYIDAWAALNNTDTVPSGKNALSPTVTYSSSSGTVDLGEWRERHLGQQCHLGQQRDMGIFGGFGIECHLGQ